MPKKKTKLSRKAAAATNHHARHTATLELKTEHMDVFLEMERAIRGSSGFRLVIAQFNDPPYREVVIQRVAGLFQRSTEVQVDDESFPSFEALEVALEDAAARADVVHLLGLERWSPGGDKDKRFKGFNYHRETVAETCPAALVLWLTEPEVKRFALEAPDMWAWRSAVANFSVIARVERVQEPDLSASRMGLSIKRRVRRIREIVEYLETNDSDQVEARSRAQLLTELGLLYNSIGRYEDALARYEESLAICREVGDRPGEGTTLNNIGEVFRLLGRYDDALARYEESLAINREVGNRSGEGRTLNNIGLVYHSQGRYEEALARYEESLAISREVGDRSGEGTTLNNIGEVFRLLSRHEDALARYEESLAILREVGNRKMEGTTLNNIGLVYESQGRYEEALARYEESLAIFREVGDRSGEGTTLWNLGRAEESRDPVLALEHLSASVAIQEEIRHPDLEKNREYVAELRKRLGLDDAEALEVDEDGVAVREPPGAGE